jgi:Tat protein translocase TatB subunit
MFGTLGGPELFLIFVVALIVFGPRKLPDIGKSLGRMMGEFRRASNEFRSTIESEVESEKIKESMRIEAPKVKPVKAKPPSPATAAGVAAADGGVTSPIADATPGAAATTVGRDGGPDGSKAAPASGTDSSPRAPEHPAEGTSGSTPAAEAAPATVSRQPPAPAPPAEEQK